MGPNSGKATGSVHTVWTACRGALGRGSGRRDLDGGLSSGEVVGCGMSRLTANAIMRLDAS
jgi:hypothetical protein